MGWKENSMFAILFLLREPFYIVSTVLLLLLPLSFLLSSRLSSASYFLSVSHDSSSITDPYPGGEMGGKGCSERELRQAVVVEAEGGGRGYGDGCGREEGVADGSRVGGLSLLVVVLPHGGNWDGESHGMFTPRVVPDFEGLEDETWRRLLHDWVWCAEVLQG
ncbi:hypothetical protein MLD38_026348 [Melastoma candidum]|uniref:Uncharacterized protein n=1 Tax=Melastoma candidum TaxID=119954 RepID=A0ACB9P063_9MYRT|nr:hypothetical protein MLD38_026348 [Melastoma candidum]